MNTDRLSLRQRKIYEAIPMGWHNAKTQTELAEITGIDRRDIQSEIMTMRRMKILIASMTNGMSGYFIPDLDNEDDRQKTKAYLDSLDHRVVEQDITSSRQRDAYEQQLSFL